MTELEEMIEDLKSEIEKRYKDTTEEIMEELEAEEDLVREVARQGFPGNTAKNTEDLEILEKERRALKKVKNAINYIETFELRAKTSKIKEERQDTDRKGSEEIMYGYSATVQSLEEAEKLLKGDEYNAEGLGKSAATTFPDSHKSVNMQLGLEGKLLNDFREENVHLLLRSSKTLEESNTLTKLKDQDFGTLKNKKEQLKGELRKRAEDLDYLLVNASKQLEATRNRKEDLKD